MDRWIDRAREPEKGVDRETDLGEEFLIAVLGWRRRDMVLEKKNEREKETRTSPSPAPTTRAVFVPLP